MVEIKLLNVENPPSFWTGAGALYGLSGYVKALPFCIMYGYAEFREQGEIGKAKVYAEETISSNKTSNKGYVEVNSPRTTETRLATQTDTEESRNNVV